MLQGRKLNTSHLISLATEIYLTHIPPVSLTCSEARAQSLRILCMRTTMKTVWIEGETTRMLQSFKSSLSKWNRACKDEGDKLLKRWMLQPYLGKRDCIYKVEVIACYRYRTEFQSNKGISCKGLTTKWHKILFFLISYLSEYNHTHT